MTAIVSDVLDKTEDSEVRFDVVAQDKQCFYCRSTDLRHAYREQFHKRKKDHGPFDLYECGNCGSLITLPPPSADVLNELYSSFQFGLSQASRQLLCANPEAIWHQECAKRLVQLRGYSSADSFTW